MYDKATANIILSGEKPQSNLLQSRPTQGFSVSLYLFNVVLDALDRATGQEKLHWIPNEQQKSHEEIMKKIKHS